MFFEESPQLIILVFMYYFHCCGWSEVYLRSTIGQQLPKLRLILPKQQTYICEVLQTKRGSIPLGMSLLVCGPAWAWTRDLQIMRTIRWYSAIANDFCFHWISNSYAPCHSRWNSLNPPNWNSLFTHCLRRIRGANAAINPLLYVQYKLH